MYFTAETQAQILRRFHFALEDDGLLLLGKSEMLITHGDLFTPIDLKRRVFRKVLRPSLRDRVRTMAFDPGNGASQSVAESLREAAFSLSGAAEVVLDAGRSLVMANDSARRMFDLGMSDLGRPIQDLELSYRPVELRAHLDSLSASPRAVEISSVRWRTGDSERILDVRVAPLLGDGALLGTSVTYVDVTERHLLQEQLTHSRRELEQAYEELQSTVEELETTNEELQSTNEELETTNEELQSTNEELETMNEELQSSNEELETMNEELRIRTTELNNVNVLVDSMLESLGMGVAVLDRELRVTMWNEHAKKLWGLDAAEVRDHHFLNLDIGLPVQKLHDSLRASVAGDTDPDEQLVQARDRTGREIVCRVLCRPLQAARGEVSGVIVLMQAIER
jgi:two-component system CheB/CheR fusion protein